MSRLTLARWAIALAIGLVMPTVIFVWNEPDRVCSASEVQAMKVIDDAMRSEKPVSGKYPDCTVDHVRTVSEVRTLITHHWTPFLFFYLTLAIAFGAGADFALWVLVGSVRLSVVLLRRGTMKLRAVSA